MVAETLLEAVARNWPVVLVVVLASYLIKNRFTRGLNRYPGPFLASITDWWRFWIVYKRRPEVEHIKLHAKLGDVVRLGPNDLSFANPQALKDIYGLNKGFIKVSYKTDGSGKKQFLTMIAVRVLPRATISSKWTPSALPLQLNI